MRNNQLFISNQNFGEYLLVEKIGEGGFGEVWLAEKDKTQFAIKLPYRNQVDWSLIVQEIGLWKLCGTHENIVPLFNAEIIDGQIGLISEFMADGSLESLLIKKQISVIEAVKTTIEILKGLDYLHQKKIIHCDLKPSNVLLQYKRPLLTDFGISKIRKTTRSFEIPSKSINGTPSYMAPEIFEGKIHTETSDIWSLGIILYRMLCGNLPFPNDNIPILAWAVTNNEYDPLPEEIPLSLHKIVEKALQKERADRFQNAREMCKALQVFLTDFEHSTITKISAIKPVSQPDLSFIINNLFRDASGNTTLAPLAFIFYIMILGGIIMACVVNTYGLGLVVLLLITLFLVHQYKNWVASTGMYGRLDHEISFDPREISRDEVDRIAEILTSINFFDQELKKKLLISKSGKSLKIVLCYKYDDKNFTAAPAMVNYLQKKLPEYLADNEIFCDSKKWYPSHP